MFGLLIIVTLILVGLKAADVLNLSWFVVGLIPIGLFFVLNALGFALACLVMHATTGRYW